MKFREIVRFELAYQLRRPWPWLAFVVLLVFAFENTRSGMLPVTLPQDFILNSPFLIATVTVFSCLIWLLVASAMAGEAAARDLQTGMQSLMNSLPISNFEYLGGRFVAAFMLNAFVLLAVQAGSLLGVCAGGVSAEIIGPFRPLAYLAAYGFIALPNAFVATAIQFSFALVIGRTLASYFGSVLLVFLSVPVPLIVYMAMGKPAIAKLLDPLGMIAVMNEMMTQWTIAEKNVRMFTLNGAMLLNRLVWVGIASATLAFLRLRFRSASRYSDRFQRYLRIPRGLRKRDKAYPQPATAYINELPVRHRRVALLQPRISFGFATRIRQTLAISRSSFGLTAASPAGWFLLVAYPMLAVLIVLVQSVTWSVPLLPRTGYILVKYLTAAITFASDYRVIVPLIIVFFVGELVWRERDALLSEVVDATSVPEAVLLLGKFVGLAWMLAAFMVSLLLAGMIAQTIAGYHHFQMGLYLQILFGLQLPEYLLFAMLVLMVHVAVDQKYVGLLVSVVVYLLIVFSPILGIEHKLLVYGSSPGWSYADMRGFGTSLGPWLWFKLYWAAWAVLLAVVARLLWVRGRESDLRTRLRSARRRFSRATMGVALLAVALIITLGGFIFYNTNVLNQYLTADEMVQRRADYERLYGRYEGSPQPVNVATHLRMEIYPKRHATTIHGSYRLINRGVVPIDSVHVEPAFYVDTRIDFDRAFKQVHTDARLGHDIYALQEPLQPGDSLILSFDVNFERSGFRNSGVRASGAGIEVLDNGTYFTSGALPVIGYQPMRELWSAEDRRKFGLPRQVTLAAPGDIDPGFAAQPAATFEAVVGTDAEQVAVAPGELRREWRAAGRRYFHYVSDVPINGMDVFVSADYHVHRERWQDVDIQVYVDPRHAKHLERVLRSIRASLQYYSSQFGRYPYRFLQVIEQPGDFLGMGVDGSGVLTGGEGFFLLDPKGNGFDAMFEIAAHEMGHQWWGTQLKPAFAEGAGVISESLAWYSAMELVKNVKGKEALRRFMHLMREPTPWPPIRTGLPLLRAMDPWANYRQGPYAMHALSEYVGEARVNEALRKLVEKKASSLATTLDLYHELQAVTPDSLKPLLHDLFEVNAFWTFDTRKASALQRPDGNWQVTFEVAAKKTLVDSAGREREVPVNEAIEIGVFAAARPGEQLGKPLYLEKHDIHSGTQTITVTVQEKPARGGIDPYNLLDWDEGDNIEKIETASSAKGMI